jgi:glycerate kinase
MRILIAPDKFKGLLSAEAVAENIAAGLRDVLPAAIIDTIPIADGGDGTAEVIHRACGGEWVRCRAHDALGRQIEARYLWLADRATAVMEMSAAAGMWRIAPAERALLRANTYGVGEMMKAAAEKGAKEILIGLGGSATNDGGFGMARSLGFRFYTSHSIVDILLARLRTGKRLDPELTGSVSDLEMLEVIESPKLLSLPRIVAPADVPNPLLGSRGATHTFGPQKGGTSEELEILERALAHLAQVVERDLGCDFQETPGAGAAGGLGFGLMSFCGAAIRPGFDLVAETLDLEAAVQKAGVVITGEGSLDDQTLEGKAPAGVARLARKLGKRVYAIVGCATENPVVLQVFDEVYSLATPSITRDEAMSRTPELLRERARELGRGLSHSCS